VLNWLLKRNKNDGKADANLALTHGILAGESQRPVSEREQMMELGINIHTIEDEYVVDTINAFINFCAKRGVLNFDLFALRNLVTKLIRTSRLDRIDAYILTLKSRQILRDIEMNMDDDAVRSGVLNYIESIEILLTTAFSDAIDGWKAKMLKVNPRYFEVKMAEGKGKGWLGEQGR